MSKGEQTHRRIVETAAAVMNRQGWLSTPVSSVLTATGLQKGGLYNHFGSMSELSEQAFAFASGQLLHIVKLRLASEGTALDKLIYLLAGFDLVGQRRPPFDAGCPILNAAIEADDTNEPLRQQVANVALEIIAELAAVIKNGQRLGQFRASIDPLRAARLLFATFEGGVMLAGLLRDPSLFAQIKNDLEDIIRSWVTISERSK